MPFDLLLSTLDFMGDTIVKDNIKVGQLLAKEKGVKLRMFYTQKYLPPILLSLIKTKWRSGGKKAGHMASKVY